jgi:hypothetical protein
MNSQSKGESTGLRDVACQSHSRGRYRSASRGQKSFWHLGPGRNEAGLAASPPNGIAYCMLALWDGDTTACSLLL